MKKKKTTRILLTGSSGFLGQHLVKALLDEQYQVYALYRSASPEFATALTDYSPNVTVQQLDFTNHTQVDSWMQQFQNSTNDGVRLNVCIHTAALSSPTTCAEHPDQARETNHPRHFLQVLQNHNPRMQIIALSTDQVYAGDDSQLYVETDDCRPVNIYGTTKRDMERTVQEFFPTSNVLLRSSIILGAAAPFCKAHDTFIHFVARRQGQDTTFFTNERRNVVSCRDVVATILWIIAQQQQQQQQDTAVCCGIYNMGGPETLSRFEMAQAVFSYLQYDPQHLVPAVKEPPEQQTAVARSPLDIGMDSNKLYQWTGRKFQRLEDVLPQIL